MYFMNSSTTKEAVMIATMAILAGTGAALSALAAAAWTWERAGEAHSARVNPPPGRLVDVGGRRLHLLVKGNAPGPTVVIEQGAGAASFFWWGVQDALAHRVRVATYDRAGLGWSDPAPRGRSIADRARELHELLSAAGVPGPFVVVGHSYGGPLASLFARDFPEAVAGLVFADTPDMEEVLGPDYQATTRRIHMPMTRAMGLLTRFGVIRLMGRARRPNPLTAGLPAAARAASRATLRACAWDAAADEIRSLWTVPPADSRPLAPGALGSKPVAVISHGQPFPGPYAALERGFHAGQARLCALSSDTLHVTLPEAGHLVQADAPEAVAEAILQVHAAARDGRPLNGGRLGQAA
jgi:pimeloyl-ACP methyl ester carboxylesterase